MTTTETTETTETTYTVLRPGHTPWLSGILTLAEAERQQAAANRVCCPGHCIVETTPDGANRWL